MKSLQVLGKRRHYAVDKHVNPPMAFPAELKNQPSGTTPGFVNYFAGNLNEKIGRPMYQTNPSVIGPLKDLIGDERDIVNRCYFADLFLMISQMDGIQPRNQLEIIARKEEKLMMLGPVLESLHGDLLKPLIDWAFEEMMRHRLFAPPPRELQGWPLEVELISMLAQAQSAARVQSIERSVGFVGSLVGAFPAGRRQARRLRRDRQARRCDRHAGRHHPLDRRGAAMSPRRGPGRRQRRRRCKPERHWRRAKTLSEAQVGDRNGLEAITGAQPAREAS